MRKLITAILNVVDERQPRRINIPSLIVSIGGSTSPPNRPNWTYVRLDLFNESTVYPAFNNTSLRVEGLWVDVEVSLNNGLYARIVGPHFSSTVPSDSTEAGRYNVPVHGANHQMPSDLAPGPDPTLIYQPAMQMLKSIGSTTSTTVSVRPLVYGANGAYQLFQGNDVDLSAHVPTIASRVRVVLIYLNKLVNEIEVLAGAEAVDNGVAPIEHPLVPSDALGSSYVKLSTGQAETGPAYVTDIRQFITDSTSSIQNQATTIGQLLVSTTGSTFSPSLPMVNKAGAILTNDEGMVVT